MDARPGRGCRAFVLDSSRESDLRGSQTQPAARSPWRLGQAGGARRLRARDDGICIGAAAERPRRTPAAAAGRPAVCRGLARLALVHGGHGDAPDRTASASDCDAAGSVATGTFVRASTRRDPAIGAAAGRSARGAASDGGRSSNRPVASHAAARAVAVVSPAAASTPDIREPDEPNEPAESDEPDESGEARSLSTRALLPPLGGLRERSDALPRGVAA